MTIAAIVVTDENNGVGKSYNFLSHLPAYMKFFNGLTKNYPVIMSRKTYEEVGHALVGKRNYVITRSPGYTAKDAKVFSTVKGAVKESGSDKVFLIGGGEMVKNLRDEITEIHRILIKVRFKTDKFYPDINTKRFDLTSSECVNAEKGFLYCVEKWERL
jgi:dihydrofolate reductase